MHTSSHTRVEVRKLFFSDLDTWYYINADWLLTGGDAGDTINDMDFMASVEQVYVDFGWMDERTWMNEEGRDHWVGTEEEAVATSYGGMNEQMQKFWRTVQLRFPRIKHVVLGDDHDRSDYHDGRLPPDVYNKVAQMCPPGISVSVDLVQGDGSTNGRLQRVFWQLITTQKDASKEILTEWDLCSRRCDLIVKPPHKVLAGPAGALMDYVSRGVAISDQTRAIRVYRIAAMEKLHFDGSHEPFTCAAQSCNVQFSQPEEYTTHVIASKHDKHHTLPEQIEKLFVENDARIDRLCDIKTEREQSLCEWWGAEGSEKRCAAEKELIHQLEQDPLYAQDKPVSEHKILKMMRRHFS